MKIPKETKEKEILPIAFLTNFVSAGWEKVGNLKDELEAIKKEFSGTKEVEDILQDLVDAYLVAIGKMEAHLSKKDYVELPKEKDLKEALTESNEGLEEGSVRTIQNSGFDFTDTEGHTAHFYTVVDPDTDLTSYDITDGIDTVVKDGVVARQALREILDFIKSHLHNRKNIMLSWNMEADGTGDCIVSVTSQDERNRPNQYRTMTNWAEAERMIRNALHLHNKPIKTNNYSNDGIKKKFQGYVYQEALTESNEEDTEPIEAKKFEDENKTEIFTELPDFKVEVEQKGDKIEIELEPKDEIVNEWPEPDMSDISDIEDAKAALASGEIRFNQENMEPQKQNFEDVKNQVLEDEPDALEFCQQLISKNIVIDEPCDWFCDFEEPIGDKISDEDLYKDK